jgi:hypothetical protein
MDMEIEVGIHVLMQVRGQVAVVPENRGMIVTQIDIWRKLTLHGFF